MNVDETDTNNDKEIEEAYKRMTADNKKHFMVIAVLAGAFAVFTAMLMYELFDTMHNIELQLRENAREAVQNDKR